MTRKKRTDIDYSKHELKVFDSGMMDGHRLLVHHLKMPGTYTNSVKFINTSGVLAVTGDFGNWIFCREFCPSSDGYISAGYWEEKLVNSSTQEPDEFDGETARSEIKDMLADKDMEFSDEENEWLDELSNAAYEGEFAYIAKIMDRPSDMDAETVPKGRKRRIWLEYVFDAFDEICQRLEAGEPHEIRHADDFRKSDQ